MGHKDHLLIVAEKSDCLWQCRYAKQVTIWGNLTLAHGYFVSSASLSLSTCMKHVELLMMWRNSLLEEWLGAHS